MVQNMSQIRLLNTTMTNVMSAMTMMVVLVLMLQLHEAKAATYIVGDQRGWTIPPYDNYYNAWASKHRVKVNDILDTHVLSGY